MFGDTRGYFGSLYTEGLYSSPEEVQQAQTRSAQAQAYAREVENLRSQLTAGRVNVPGNEFAALAEARNMENRGTTIEEMLKDRTEVYDQLAALGEIREGDYNPYDHIKAVNEAADAFRATPQIAYSGGVAGAARGNFGQAAPATVHGQRTQGAVGATTGGAQRGTQPTGLMNLRGASSNLPGGVGMQEDLQRSRTPGGFSRGRSRRS